MKDKDDPLTYAWYLDLLRVIVFGTLAIFNWKLVTTPKALLLILLFGLADALGIYFYMRMHSLTHLSISAIVTRSRALWVAIFAFFLIGEHLRLIDYAGLLVIFLGISTISAPKKFFVDRGLMYANAATILFAFCAVLNKMLLPYASDPVINASMALPGAFLLPFFMKNPQKQISTLLRTNLKLKSLASGLNIFSILLFTLTLRIGGDASRTTAIYQGMLIFSVLAGIFLLKEKENIGKKLIGTAITLAGVLILSLT